MGKTQSIRTSLLIYGASLWWLASVAAAQPAPLSPPAGESQRTINAELISSAPPGCPDAATLQRATEEILERPLRSTDDEPALTLEITITEGPDGMAAELSIRRRDGQLGGVRSLTTSDNTCRTLARGLPLVAAMLVDLTQREAMMHLPEESASEPVPSAADRGPTAAARSEPLPESADASSLGGGLVAGVAFDLGLLPQAVFYPQLTLSLAPVSWLTLLVRGAIIAPQTHDVGEERGVSIWGVLGALGACVPTKLPPLRLSGCGALEAGWLSTNSVGFERARSNESLHLGLEVTARVEFVGLAPWVLGVDVGALVPLVGQRFVAHVGEDEVVLFTSSSVGLRGGLWAGLSWP